MSGNLEVLTDADTEVNSGGAVLGTEGTQYGVRVYRRDGNAIRDLELAIPLWRDRRLVLGGGRLAYFLGYCALFTLATEVELLSGPRRALTGFEDALPRNFLALNRLGDWHYWLVGSRPSAEAFMLPLLPPFETREESRNTFAALIQAAATRQAKGFIAQLSSSSRQ